MIGLISGNILLDRTQQKNSLKHLCSLHYRKAMFEKHVLKES